MFEIRESKDGNSFAFVADRRVNKKNPAEEMVIMKLVRIALKQMKYVKLSILLILICLAFFFPRPCIFSVFLIVCLKIIIILYFYQMTMITIRKKQDFMVLRIQGTCQEKHVRNSIMQSSDSVCFGRNDQIIREQYLHKPDFQK